MNIFILSTDPVLAARAHCDQHLHKMILESAQLISAAYHSLIGGSLPVYAPAYVNHPCTQWVCSSLVHVTWTVRLAEELDRIRLRNGSPSHSSIPVIQSIANLIPTVHWNQDPTHFAEAMFPHIKCRTDLSTVEKYQLYYRKKHNLWKLTGKSGMTYKGRPVPDFMQSVLET